MGFFDFLGDTWHAVASYARSQWRDEMHAFDPQYTRKFARASYDLSTAPWDKEDREPWWRTAVSYAGRTMGVQDAGGQPKGLPGAAVSAQSWLYKEGVSQPVSTGYLMLADARDDGFDSLFDANEWSKAYGEADRVSPGQAMVFSGQKLLLGDDRHDPRKDQKRWHSGWRSYSSGTADLALNIFADPTVVAGKALKVGKLAALSKPFTGDAVAKGKRYVAGTQLSDKARTAVGMRSRFDAFADSIAKAENPTEIHQRYLKDHAYGGMLATTLWDVKDDRRAVGLVIRSSLGDDVAWRKLTKEAPRIAERIGSKRGWFDAATLSKNALDLSDDEFARLEAYRETRVQAFADAIANGKGVWGHVQPERGILVGEKQPRWSLTGKLRWGVHQWSRWDAPQTIVPALRKVMPSAKIVRMLDLNDHDSGGAFLAWLERSGLDRETVGKLHGQYISKTSPQWRYGVAQKAEELAFRTLAARHGYTEKELGEVIPEINRRKGKAYRTLNNRPAYVSDELRKRIDNGQTVDPELKDAADSVGEMFMSTLDEDGNLLLHERGSLADNPLLNTQTADWLPMQDVRDLDWSLSLYGKDKASHAGYIAVASTTRLLDFVRRQWQTAVLLRGGYPVRAASDESLRGAALHGLTPWLLNAAASAARVTNNAAYRASRRLSGGRARHDLVTEGITAGVEDVVDATAKLPKKRFAGADDGMHSFASMDEAVARGAISASDYLGWAKANWRDLPEVDKALLKSPSDDATKRYLLVRRALIQHGRGAWYQPQVQRAILDDAAAKGGFMVDPATGARRDLEPEFWSAKNTRRLVPDESGRYAIDDVHDYVAEHVDELYEPGKLLSVAKAPNGQLRLAVAEPLGELDDAIKSDAARERLGFADDWFRLRERGARNVRVKGHHGTYTFQGAFEGTEGALKRAQASSRGDANLFEHLFETEQGRMVDATHDWKGSIYPDADDYDAAWTRAAVSQVGQDPVASQFLRGRTVDDVVAWLEDSPRGKAYLGSRPDIAHNYRRWASAVEMVAHEYVPDVAELRRKVLDQSATAADLRRLVPDDRLPVVHGQTVDVTISKNNPELHKLKKTVQKTMKILGQTAPDKAARWPFFDKAYRTHLDILVKAREKHLGNAVPVDEIEKLQKTAHQKALRDVKKWLYESGTEFDAAHFIRNAVPFPNAVLDAFSKWTKLAVQEDPSVAARIWQLWAAPDRHGLVVDAQGRVLDPDDHGNERWYEVDPVTGERTRVSGEGVGKDRYITFQAPSWATANAYGKGAKTPIAIPKTSFNTILNQPGAGPVVQMATNELTLRDPKLWDNPIVKNFILPYGPDAGKAGDKFLGLYGGTYKKAMPASVQRAYDVLTNSDEGQGTEYLTMSILQTEETKYSLGLRDDKPSVAEARSRAWDLMLVRLAASLTAPVTLTPHSPFKPYVDAYRQLQAKDPQSADRVFHERFGDEMFWLTAKTTQNLTGMLASGQSYKLYREYEGLVKQYPRLAGLIVGADGAGDFNKAVYEWQKTQTLTDGSDKRVREVLSLAESSADVAERRGWINYRKMKDQLDYMMAEAGLSSLRQKGGEQLKAMRDMWIDANKYVYNDRGEPVGLTPWYKDYSQFDMSRMEERLVGLRQIAQSPILANRTDVEGLREYLWGRAQMKDVLANSEYKTLGAQANAPLALQWDGFVTDLRRRNLAFASLHSRWLSSDDDLEAD